MPESTVANNLRRPRGPRKTAAPVTETPATETEVDGGIDTRYLESLLGYNARRPLRIATYNVEWFNALFDDHARLIEDAAPSARHQVSRAQQVAALGRVFGAIDADAVMVIEAPDTNGRRSTVKALQTFAKAAGLRAHRAIIGYPSETEQEIAFLYDPDRLTARHDPQGNPSTSHGSHDAPRFDTTFRYDLDADNISETIRFSKPPLELAVTTARGQKLRGKDGAYRWFLSRALPIRDEHGDIVRHVQFEQLARLEHLLGTNRDPAVQHCPVL